MLNILYLVLVFEVSHLMTWIMFYSSTSPEIPILTLFLITTITCLLGLRGITNYLVDTINDR